MPGKPVISAELRHCKAIAATGEAVHFGGDTFAGKSAGDKAVILSRDNAKNAADDFIKAIAEHRNWDRETARKVPA